MPPRIFRRVPQFCRPFYEKRSPMSLGFRDPLDSFPLRAQSLRAGYGNHESSPPNPLATNPHGKGTTSVVPYALADAASAAEVRRIPTNAPQGLKPRPIKITFGTAEAVPFPVLLMERINVSSNRTRKHGGVPNDLPERSRRSRAF